MNRTFTCVSAPRSTCFSERENVVSYISIQLTKLCFSQSLNSVLWAPISDATHFHLGVAYLVGRPNGGTNS